MPSLAAAWRLTPKTLAALEKCKVIAGSGVGFDYVDVPAATRAGIVVTNVPDVFIEEVADHAMTLLLACWRRLITQDRIVREGRWGDGREELSKHARLQGQTLGLHLLRQYPAADYQACQGFRPARHRLRPFHSRARHAAIRGRRHGQSARVTANR